MSVAQKAASGVAWTIAVSITSRAIGLAAMLMVTRFLTPAEYGEVQVAAVLVFTTSILTSFGLPNYVVAKPHASPQIVFTAALYYMLIGVVTLIAILVLDRQIGSFLDAPDVGRFLPGLVLAGLFNRAAIPAMRTLARDLRFRVVAGANAGGEVCFGVVSVVLAARGYDGHALVIGNIVRHAVLFLVTLYATRGLLWRTLYRPTKKDTRELFRFGIPIWLGNCSAVISARWDNLLVTRLLGTGAVGRYNLAYNLADIPAVHIGEHVGDVLLPSFARIAPDKRPTTLIRATAMLTLIMAPLAVGLGAVAPTLVGFVFDPRWSEVGVMLTILAGLAVVRPIGWTVNVYLVASDHPRAVMLLGFVRMVLVLSLIALLAPMGLYWVCIAPGLAFTLHSLAGIAVVRSTDGVSMPAMLGGMLRPIAACAPMIAAVLGVRSLELGATGLGLLCEVVAGAATYVPVAWLVANPAARELLRIVKRLLRRRS